MHSHPSVKDQPLGLHSTGAIAQITLERAKIAALSLQIPIASSFVSRRMCHGWTPSQAEFRPTSS